MTIPEPGRIVNTQPMTVDRRWPPARHSPAPVTQARTNVTVGAHPLYALIEEHYPSFVERLEAEGVSLPHFVMEEFRGVTSSVGVSNTDSCASSARPAGMRSSWRSVANAAASARAAAHAAWPRPPRISSTTSCPSNRSASGWCRSPTRCGSVRDAPRGPHPSPCHRLPGNLHLPHPSAPDCAWAPAPAPEPSPSSSDSARR